MINFQPDQVSFNDAAGYSAWDNSHHREHLQFAALFAAQNPAIVLPTYDLLAFLGSGPARPSLVQSHAQMHVLIRQQAGFTGVDLSSVDLDDEGSFYDWTGRHATDHAQIRQFLGIS